mmetsp:Transcript_7875/g.48728  ORF Transcript_7875/g.48728 Transcript_7875/m.48728 type:complete len:274 (-) Transcript_7875:1082-1903(-)
MLRVWLLRQPHDRLHDRHDERALQRRDLPASRDRDRDARVDDARHHRRSGRLHRLRSRIRLPGVEVRRRPERHHRFVGHQSGGQRPHRHGRVLRDLLHHPRALRSDALAAAAQPPHQRALGAADPHLHPDFRARLPHSAQEQAHQGLGALPAGGHRDGHRGGRLHFRLGLLAALPALPPSQQQAAARPRRRRQGGGEAGPHGGRGRRLARDRLDAASQRALHRLRRHLHPLGRGAGAHLPLVLLRADPPAWAPLQRAGPRAHVRRPLQRRGRR